MRLHGHLCALVFEEDTTCHVGFLWNPRLMTSFETKHNLDIKSQQSCITARQKLQQHYDGTTRGQLLELGRYYVLRHASSSGYWCETTWWS